MAWSNCIGYALYRLGLRDDDSYQDLPDWKGKDGVSQHFERSDEMEGDMVIVTNKAGVVEHMAVVDPSNRDYVYERSGEGYPVQRIRVLEAISPYDPQSVEGRRKGYRTGWFRFLGQKEGE